MRWKREDRRIGRIRQDADEKTGWPKANGIFRGVRAHLGAPMGRMAHWGEEEERSGADAGRKTGGAERRFFRRRPAIRPIRSVIGGSARIGGAEIKMSAKKPPRRAAERSFIFGRKAGPNGPDEEEQETAPRHAVVGGEVGPREKDCAGKGENGCTPDQDTKSSCTAECLKLPPNTVHTYFPLCYFSIATRRATKSPRRSTTGESTKKNKPYRNSHQNFKVLLHLFRIGIVISHKTTPFYSQLTINSRGKPKPSMRRPNPMRI